MTRRKNIAWLAPLLLGAASAPAFGQPAPSPAASAPAPMSGLTYADLVSLSEAAPLVLRAEVVSQAVVKPERAPGLRPGFARLYVEAKTQTLLSGDTPVGESLRYLVDVPVDAKGRPPKLKKRQVFLFARSGQRPAEIQLIDPHAQLAYSPELEARLRPVLGQLAAADKPPVVTGIRDALSVAGNLAGESETQIFLDTASGDPVSATVVRRPGQRPQWGVSWSELVDQSARPPQPETLGWYRLACTLPPRLPDEANLARNSASRTRAAEDYAYILQQLGPCPRTRS
ncbi:hypothetical protein [Qipengyuania spongiae]|uniref:Uncharacterized protein n=1 Tax=Qipengyuania spongiae TaxID=2909673 RepID=A0ABY5T108_9SPHN|nr:hypothetical protein [Qipengyuania spongiae]UVI40100.1 hypothetical protein L1F33_03845 [Qipengyuania spongiae]